MKRALVPSLGAVALSLVMIVPAESNHAYDDRPHWRGTAIETTVQVTDSVTTRWDAALRDGAADWSLSPQLKVDVVPGSTRRRVRKRCAYGENEIRVCNYGYGTRWAGLAEFDYGATTGHIVRARIRLNDSATRRVDAGVLAAIACHELGHALGLDHYPDPQPPDSCMATPSRPGGPEDPSAHDYAEIANSYGHLDSTGTSTSRSADLIHVKVMLPA